MTDWARHVHRPATPQEVQHVRNAAQDLARQASHSSGKTRVVFQTVAEVALVGTAVLSGALAAVALWKKLAHRHDSAHNPAAKPAAGGRIPPSHKNHPPAATSGDSNSFHHRHHAGTTRCPPGERH